MKRKCENGDLILSISKQSSYCVSALNHAGLKTMVITVLLRWMCRSSANKVLPAMYIEEETELAFDDVTPDDPDFAAIQGMDTRHLRSFTLFNNAAFESFLKRFV